MADRVSPGEADARLTLFVYGTLKRGGRYHRRYAAGFRSIDDATVLGRRYTVPAGYPVLIVPQESVLARGSADLLADAARQADVVTPAREAAGGEAWEDVPGELLVFDDPRARLPPIDRLEGFRPGASSLYDRVLLLARRHRDGRLVPAWTYVEGDELRAGGFRSPR